MVLLAIHLNTESLIGLALLMTFIMFALLAVGGFWNPVLPNPVDLPSKPWPQLLMASFLTMSTIGFVVWGILSNKGESEWQAMIVVAAIAVNILLFATMQIQFWAPLLK